MMVKCFICGDSIDDREDVYPSQKGDIICRYCYDNEVEKFGDDEE